MSLKLEYQPSGLLEEEAGRDPHKAGDLEMAKQIGAVLTRAYPYPKLIWGVRVDGAQGVAMIKIPDLMGQTGQYVLKLSDLAGDPGMKSVIRAGGEILERFRLSRGKIVDAGDYARALTRRVKSVHDEFPE